MSITRGGKRSLADFERSTVWNCPRNYERLNGLIQINCPFQQSETAELLGCQTLNKTLKILAFYCWHQHNDISSLLLKSHSGLLFTKRLDVLPQDLVESRSREIGCYDNRIALKFSTHLGSAADELPVKWQSDCKNLNLYLTVARFHEILR